MKIFIYIILINLLAFIIYGSDKHKAKTGKWRIPEAVLIGAALAGGSVGAFAAMKLFRHKTRHVKFYVGVPLILIMQVVLLVIYIKTS